jgi:hypothetical protein
VWLLSALSSPLRNSHLHQQLRGARRGIVVPTSRADGRPHLQLRSGRHKVWEPIELFHDPMAFSSDTGKKLVELGVVVAPFTEATSSPYDTEASRSYRRYGGPSTRSEHPGRGRQGEGGGWLKRAQPPGDPELLMLMVVRAWCPMMS